MVGKRVTASTAAVGSEGLQEVPLHVSPVPEQSEMGRGERNSKTAAAAKCSDNNDIIIYMRAPLRHGERNSSSGAPQPPAADSRGARELTRRANVQLLQQHHSWKHHSRQQQTAEALVASASQQRQTRRANVQLSQQHYSWKHHSRQQRSREALSHRLKGPTLNVHPQLDQVWMAEVEPGVRAQQEKGNSLF
eukprot:351839-Chlamydomonas_euryale.AAC.6